MSNKYTDTKEKIIYTTIDMIGQNGIQSATAGNISKAGDFNKSIIFYYFENIEKLLLTSLEVSIDKLSPIFTRDFYKYENIEDFLNLSIENLISSKDKLIHLKVILSFIHQTMYYKDLVKKYHDIVLDDLFYVLIDAINYYKNKDLSTYEIETLASLIMATFNGLGVILLIDGSNDRFINNWKMQVKLIKSYI